MEGKTLPIKEKSEFLADLIGDRFLKLAQELRELKDTQPDILWEVVELAGISRRKAYALVRIARQFEELDIPEARLYAIGWTKLAVIGRYLTELNGEQLLKLAEQNTVHDLEALLRGEAPVEDARLVTLYLAPEQYEVLRTKLVAHGALPSGNGMIKVEEALMAALASATG
ncbi:hypothetical protein [Manganibacter manganicus]|uniref:Uncharacterized protein n=1 Tax=Manganibacter manganicus TaxID=1873176 RepID=A0A1V8RSY1_9HYPH|nr:hypothetical protein [Pseudaminobacter manganicus]OQM76238.1 hypothetical protein BFN67_15195 [Pseudaminobacter manganicus]